MTQTRNKTTATKKSAAKKTSAKKPAPANKKVVQMTKAATSKPAKKAPTKTAAKKPAVKKVASKKASPAAQAKPTSKPAAKNTTQNNASIFDAFGFSKLLAAPSDEVKNLFSNNAFSNAEASDQLEKATDTVSRVVEESQQFSNEAAELCTEASEKLVEGVQQVNESLFDFANDLIAKNIEMSQEFLSCRTFSDFFDVQTQMITSNVEDFCAESSRLADRNLEIANQIAEPAAERLAEAADKASKAFTA